MTSKQQRRADKKRREAAARQQYQRQAAGAFEASDGARQNVEELAEMALRAAGAGLSSSVQFERLIDHLVDVEGSTPGRVEPHFGSMALDQIARLWEQGWQPLDVVHVAKRSLTPRIGRLASFLVRAEAAKVDRFSEMPDEWADQLAALGRRLSADERDWPLRAWASEERLHHPDLFADTVRLLAFARLLPKIATLCDPPSRWSQQRRPVGADVRSTASAKTLATIRALLAKAESTTFPAEAETFAAKAQELMTRHSIDAALLDVRHGEDLAAGVRSRRLHLDNPYAKEKYRLLATVAEINGVRAVFSEGLGFSTAVGFPADLDVVDLLFTSLLVQAARALSDTSAVVGRGSSPAFRRAFWISYAVRVGERLKEARQHAAEEAQREYGTSLVPVLAERREAVESVTQQLFAHTRPMKSRSVDAEGWYAGRAAADLANLEVTRGRLKE